MTRGLRHLAVAFLVCAAPAIVIAQEPPSWTSKLEVGEPLFVTTGSDERIAGLLGQVTADEVVVATPAGIRNIAYRDIRQAQTRDAAWTGAVAGAVTGIAAGGCAAFIVDCDNGACRRMRGAMIMGGAMYGALIGWGVDALTRGRSTVFRAEAAPRMTFAIGRSGGAAALAFSW
jgi:hypothetical protein